MKRHTIAISTVLTLVVAGVGFATPANAAGSDSDGLSAGDAAEYTDQDVVEFFLFASGPAAKEHPEILENLGAEPKARPDAVDLAQVTDALLSVDPEFHESVTLAVQAGDPYQAESAVERLVKDVQDLQASSGTKGSDPTGAAGKTSVSFFPYTTVAVTFGVVVTVLVVVSVAGVFLALYENPGDASDLTKQDLAANLAASF